MMSRVGQALLDFPQDLLAFVNVVKLQNPSGLVWPNDRLWRNCGIVNPYAIVFLFPPVPAILEAIIFEIMRCSKHPSKHPNIQACSKHPSTHPNIHPSISMHRSIQTSKQSSQFTNSTPQPTRQRNEASLKGAPRRILILNSPKPFKIMRLLKGISRSYAAVFLLVFLCPFSHKATQSH